MYYRLLLLIILVFPLYLSAQTPTAQQVLERSIQYHDPSGQWPKFKGRLFFESQRPDSTRRKTTIELDNRKSYFLFKREAENVERGVKDGDCFIVSGEAECDAIKRTRNYYIYLWGLPMKLQDPGTPLDPKVEEGTFDEHDCYILYIPYEKDIWYFYFDKSNYALRGYEFYFDREKTRGERIHLESEVQVGKMHWPNGRRWVTTHDNQRYLATDFLVKVENL